MQHGELITAADAFSTLRAQCTAVFDIEKRLPEQVFKKKFDRHRAFEHGLIYQEKFAIYLASLARRFTDTSVNYMTLEPDPVDYYLKHCGFYGLASFAPASLISDYMMVMSRNRSADSLLVRGGDVGIFWGSSLQWGIFCDRISWELCVVGFSGNLNDPITDVVNYMDMQVVRDYVANAYRHEPAVAQNFLNGFENNYPDL